MKAPVVASLVAGSASLLGGRRRGRVVAPRGVRTGVSKQVLLAVGLALLLGGLVLAYVGLRPLSPLWEVIMDGPSAMKRHEAWMEDLSSHLGDAALPVGLALAAVLAAAVLIQMGVRAPAPPPLEDIVRAEVERRMAGQAHAPMGTSAMPLVATPLARPASSTPTSMPVSPGPSAAHAARPRPASVPAPELTPVRRTHCSGCGTVLVAGGRICPQGHAQA